MKKEILSIRLESLPGDNTLFQVLEQDDAIVNKVEDEYISFGYGIYSSDYPRLSNNEICLRGFNKEKDSTPVTTKISKEKILDTFKMAFTQKQELRLEQSTEDENFYFIKINDEIHLAFLTYFIIDKNKSSNKIYYFFQIHYCSPFFQGNFIHLNGNSIYLRPEYDIPEEKFKTYMINSRIDVNSIKEQLENFVGKIFNCDIVEEDNIYKFYR